MHSKIITIDGVYEKVVKWDICIYRKREEERVILRDRRHYPRRNQVKNLWSSLLFYSYFRGLMQELSDYPHQTLIVCKKKGQNLLEFFIEATTFAYIFIKI